jgi:hypothetical protein
MLLLTFPQQIQPGIHEVKIAQLIDASGMQGDTGAVYTFTSVVLSGKEFFVKAASMTRADRIRIEYSEQPDFRTAANRELYSVRNSLQQFTIASVDSIDPVTVLLNLPGANLSRLALRLEITMNDSITSASGKTLIDGRGQIVSIAQDAQSIDAVIVYPNPVKSSQQLSFVNLPEDCTISIFSVQGDRVKDIGPTRTSEGISWNLRDERGNAVASGIYLYRIEQMNSDRLVVKTTLGKFAVIR